MGASENPKKHKIPILGVRENLVVRESRCTVSFKRQAKRFQLGDYFAFSAERIVPKPKMSEVEHSIERKAIQYWLRPSGKPEELSLPYLYSIALSYTHSVRMLRWPSVSYLLFSIKERRNSDKTTRRPTSELSECWMGDCPYYEKRAWFSLAWARSDAHEAGWKKRTLSTNVPNPLLEDVVTFITGGPGFKAIAMPAIWKLGRTMLCQGGSDNEDAAKSVLDMATRTCHKLVADDDRREKSLGDEDWDDLVFYLFR
ncbi:hypothetical protein CC80DRAFT_504997 [Byssothecium circinans]|uniref:Uncharacterized protein n=1 Tax=Byssothecium circinans TaxID=147558 RepID=A0A6A5TU18_9PLEO|nr:hypothetical protein CC80DRAFT_504997 [Byssothecium circinans]